MAPSSLEYARSEWGGEAPERGSSAVASRGAMGAGPCGESDVLGGDTLGGVVDGGSAGGEVLDAGREEGLDGRAEGLEGCGEDAPSLPSMRSASLCSRASIVGCLCGDGGGTCFGAAAWSLASMLDCLRSIEGTCFEENDKLRALGSGHVSPPTRTKPPSSLVAQPSGGDSGSSVSSRSICVISSESHRCCLACGDASPSVSACDGPRLIAAGLGALVPPMPLPSCSGGTPVGV
jgi:hypothetical protein